MERRRDQRNSEREKRKNVLGIEEKGEENEGK